MNEQHDPQKCIEGHVHDFRDVGLNLAECKHCGMVIMHSGMGQAWTEIEQELFDECDRFGHDFIEGGPNKGLCQRCGIPSYMYDDEGP